MNGRNTIIWAITIASKGMLEQEAEVWSWSWLLNPDTPKKNAGILSIVLTARPNAFPILLLFIYLYF